MAHLLRFYPGLTTAEVRAMTAADLSVFVDVMMEGVSGGS